MISRNRGAVRTPSNFQTARQFHADTVEMTRALLARAATSDPIEKQRLLDEVVLINLSLAESLARRYRERGEDLDDLEQVARLALIKAAQRYDVVRGEFSAFATATVLGELKRHFRDHVWTVRPPRRLQELRSQVSATWSDLAQQLGRPPTRAELAAVIGTDEASVDEAWLAMQTFHVASLDTPRGEGTQGMIDSLGDLDDDMSHVEDLSALAPAWAQLEEPDRRLLRLRFSEQLTQTQIAQLLGTNQMAISRRLAKVLDRMRRSMIAEPADGSIAA